jgi:hypothetical protein
MRRAASPIITGYLQAIGEAQRAEPVGINKEASQDHREISLVTERPMCASSR